MTRDDRAALRALLALIPPAPWKAEPGLLPWFVPDSVLKAYRDSLSVRAADEGEWGLIPQGVVSSDVARFIVAIRNAAEEMLDDCDRLEAKRAFERYCEVEDLT